MASHQLEKHKIGSKHVIFDYDVEAKDFTQFKENFRTTKYLTVIEWYNIHLHMINLAKSIFEGRKREPLPEVKTLTVPENLNLQVEILPMIEPMAKIFKMRSHELHHHFFRIHVQKIAPPLPVNNGTAAGEERMDEGMESDSSVTVPQTPERKVVKELRRKSPEKVVQPVTVQNSDSSGSSILTPTPEKEAVKDMRMKSPAKVEKQASMQLPYLANKTSPPQLVNNKSKIQNEAEVDSKKESVEEIPDSQPSVISRTLFKSRQSPAAGHKKSSSVLDNKSSPTEPQKSIFVKKPAAVEVQDSSLMEKSPTLVSKAPSIIELSDSPQSQKTIPDRKDHKETPKKAASPPQSQKTVPDRKDHKEMPKKAASPPQSQKTIPDRKDHKEMPKKAASPPQSQKTIPDRKDHKETPKRAASPPQSQKTIPDKKDHKEMPKKAASPPPYASHAPYNPSFIKSSNSSVEKSQVYVPNSQEDTIHEPYSPKPVGNIAMDDSISYTPSKKINTEAHSNRTPSKTPKTPRRSRTSPRVLLTDLKRRQRGTESDSDGIIPLESSQSSIPDVKRQKQENVSELDQTTNNLRRKYNLDPAKNSSGGGGSSKDSSQSTPSKRKTDKRSKSSPSPKSKLSQEELFGEISEQSADDEEEVASGDNEDSWTKLQKKYKQLGDPSPPKKKKNKDRKRPDTPKPSTSSSSNQTQGKLDGWLNKNGPVSGKTDAGSTKSPKKAAKKDKHKEPRKERAPGPKKVSKARQKEIEEAERQRRERERLAVLRQEEALRMTTEQLEVMAAVWKQEEEQRRINSELPFLDCPIKTYDELKESYKEYRDILTNMFTQGKDFNRWEKSPIYLHVWTISKYSENMLNILQEELGEEGDCGRYTVFFQDVLTPEWTLQIFMRQHGMDRARAIDHILRQDDPNFDPREVEREWNIVPPDSIEY